jgi:hypothetical protein
LLWRWVEPELVRSLDFHSHIIVRLCKDSNTERRAGVGLATQAALSLPGLKAEVSRAELEI